MKALIILMLLLPFEAYTKVLWILVTNPVVFGGEVELFCNTSASSSNNFTARTWWRNEKEDVLTFGDLTIDHEKYSTRLVSDGFNLVIKNFSEQDITSYTCNYGADVYMSNLKVGEDFEKIPQNSSIIKNITLTSGRRLDIIIHFLEVHPVPICRVYMYTMNTYVSRNLIILSAIKKGLYYDVLFKFSYDEDCHTVIFSANCSIGTSNMEVWETNVTLHCKDEQSTDIIIQVIITVCFLVVISICITCFLAIKSKRLNKNLFKSMKYLVKFKNVYRNNGTHDLPVSFSSDQDITFESIPLLDESNIDESAIPPCKNNTGNGNFFELSHSIDFDPGPVFDMSDIQGSKPMPRQRIITKHIRVETKPAINYSNEVTQEIFISNNMFGFYCWPDIKRYVSIIVHKQDVKNNKKDK